MINWIEKVHLKEKITFILAPRFLTKMYILDSIKLMLKKYGKDFYGKKLLDVGCGSKPYAPMFRKLGVEYTGIDFKSYSPNKTFSPELPDLYFDANYTKNFRLPKFKTGSYDIITSFEVLEHSKEPEVFFEEASRILKKGGYLVVSVPFIWELHMLPYDYYRYSEFKIRDFCEKNNFTIIETINRGNAFSTILQLSIIAVTEQKWPFALRVLIYGLIFYPLQILTYLFSGFFTGPMEDQRILLGYLFLMKKGRRGQKT